MTRVILAALASFIIAGPATAAVEIQEVTSPGGFKAWLVEEHSIPVGAIDVRSVHALPRRNALASQHQGHHDTRPCIEMPC